MKIKYIEINGIPYWRGEDFDSVDIDFVDENFSIWKIKFFDKSKVEIKTIITSYPVMIIYEKNN